MGKGGGMVVMVRVVHVHFHSLNLFVALRRIQQPGSYCDG